MMGAGPADVVRACRVVAASDAGGVSVPLALALVDAAAGGYLLVYAVRRERRDKPGVMVTGVVLLMCAAVLAMLAVVGGGGVEPVPGLLPAGPSQSV